MTIEEAIAYFKSPYNFSYDGVPIDPYKYTQAEYIAIKCMERCKRIDEAEFRDTESDLSWGDEDGFMHSRGWNDCLKWAKKEE